MRQNIGNEKKIEKLLILKNPVSYELKIEQILC